MTTGIGLPSGRAGRLFAAELRNLGNSKSNFTAVNGGFTPMTRGHSPFLPQHSVQCESDIETVVSAHATYTFESWLLMYLIGGAKIIL